MVNINGESGSHASDQSRRETGSQGAAGIVGNITENIAETGKQRIEAEKQAAAEHANRLAGVMERTSEELNRGNFASLAGYTEQLASSLKNFADGLRYRSIEQLIDDTRRAARRNPELFFLGSIAAGVVLARFLKASTHGARMSSLEDTRAPGSASGAAQWRSAPQAQMEDVHIHSTSGTSTPGGSAVGSFAGTKGE